LAPNSADTKEIEKVFMPLMLHMLQFADEPVNDKALV